MIYAKNAEQYLKKGMLPIHLAKGQQYPVDDDWAETYDEEKAYEDITNRPLGNIGLICGKKSGIVAVDIDVDGEVFEQITKKLPYTKSKRGRKGATFFYKYNGEESFSIQGVVDVLSDGRQTVIPPSIHPKTNKPYVWVDGENIDWDDIPDCPNLDFLYEFAKEKEVASSSGRNETLKSVVGAMLDRGESFDHMLVEIIKTDKELHDQPLFEDKNEMRSFKTPEQKAFAFITNIAKSAMRKGWNPNIEQPKQITITETKKPKKRYHDLPHLRGVAKDMFDIVYESNPVKRSSFAFASAISAMSVILGNKVQYEGIMTNIYCMILAESGGGKNKPLQFINQLLIESGCDFLIGDAHPVGDTSLICDLPFQRTRIDVIDEASIFFGSLHSQNRHQSKMGDVYADLYSSAGKFFGGKRIKKQGKDEQRTQTIGRCNSPCVSMLTAMTPTAFEKCVNKETIETGLGARFLYFYDNRTKSPKYSVPLTQIPDHIKDFVRMWRDSDPENQTITFNPSLKTLVFDSKAQLGLRAVHEKINEQSFLKGREHMKAIRNRLFENIVKLSMIDACSVNRSLNPVVMSDSVKWGARAGLAIFNNIERFIDTYVHSGANDQRLNKVFRVIDEAGIDGITRTDLAKKSRMLKSELNQVIATLKDFGQIGEFKPEKTTFYVSHNYFEGV